MLCACQVLQTQLQQQSLMIAKFSMLPILCAYTVFCMQEVYIAFRSSELQLERPSRSHDNIH